MIQRLLIRSLVSLLPFALASLAQAQSPDCHEESLVHFVSQEKEVASESIGKDNPCDHFGGNLVYTPKHHIRLFVNFNIAGTINLDEVDQALDDAQATEMPPLVKLPKMPVSVVEDGWIEKTYGADRDGNLSWAQDALFVSARVVTQGRFTAFMREFYREAAPIYH